MTCWEAFREQTKYAVIGVGMGLAFGAGISTAYLLFRYDHYIVAAISIVVVVIGTLVLCARSYQRMVNRTDRS